MATINFTQQAATINFSSPGRGAEQWHGGYEVDLSPFQKLDKYWRGQWHQFEKAQGVYDFTEFDAQLHEAMDRGGKFGFGIMTVCDCDANSLVNYAGGASSYPQYLHTLMQAESVKDKLFNGLWIPNWNSVNYLSRFEALLKAIYTHLDSTYNGVKLRDAISYIDIRGFGNYGEWHISGIEGATSNPTIASFKRIIDAHINAFPDVQLVSLIAALDGGSTGWSVFPAPAEISYYLLTAKNNVGEIGWRRDSLGSTEIYLSQILENNTVIYNGVSLKTLIMNKYQKAPVVGEPNFGIQMTDLTKEVNLYHMNSFGNSNYGVSLSAASITAIKAAALAAGYRLTLISGDVSYSNGTLSLMLNWQNKGIAPIYENWDAIIELKNGSSVVWSGKSSFKPRLFLPSTSPTLISDTFIIPSTIVGGVYNLSVKLIDPKGYRKPLPLAITGQQADGSYSLGTIAISSTQPVNQPPVANAGADLIVTLPTNIISLDGTGSKDPDGTLSSYTWSQVSGPQSAFLTPANQPKPNVILSSIGIYIYKVSVVDNAGASSSDNVSIILNPPPPIVVEKQIQSITITYTDGTTKIYL